MVRWPGHAASTLALAAVFVLLFCNPSTVHAAETQEGQTPFEWGETNHHLKDALNAALEDLIIDGTWSSIIGKWATIPGEPEFNCDFGDSVGNKKFPYPPRITGDNPDDIHGTWYFAISRRMLRLGSTFNTPPLNEGNATHHEGLEADLAEALAERLTHQYLSPAEIGEHGPVLPVWHNITKHSSFFGDLSFALNSDAPLVDVLLATLADTPERRETVDFTCSYLAQNLAVLRGPLDNDTVIISSEADLNNSGVLIAVGLGTTNAEYANVSYPLASLVLSNGMDDRMHDLRNGLAHVAIGDYVLMAHALQECPGCTLLNFSVGPLTYLSMAVRIDGKLVDTNSTCTDGKHNGDEEGVDCGGSCSDPCEVDDPTCMDAKQNGDEEGIDCGGSCPFNCGSVQPSHLCGVVSKHQNPYPHFFKACDKSACGQCSASSPSCSVALGSSTPGPCCDGYQCCHSTWKMCTDEQTGTEYRCGSSCLKSTSDRLCEIQVVNYYDPTVAIQLYDPKANKLNPQTETEIRRGVTSRQNEAQRFLDLFKPFNSEGAVYGCMYNPNPSAPNQLIMPLPSAAPASLVPSLATPLLLLVSLLVAGLTSNLAPRWSF